MEAILKKVANSIKDTFDEILIDNSILINKTNLESECKIFVTDQDKWEGIRAFDNQDRDDYQNSALIMVVYVPKLNLVSTFNLCYDHSNRSRYNLVFNGENHSTGEKIYKIKYDYDSQHDYLEFSDCLNSIIFNVKMEDINLFVYKVDIDFVHNDYIYIFDESGEEDEEDLIGLDLVCGEFLSIVSQNPDHPIYLKNSSTSKNTDNWLGSIDSNIAPMSNGDGRVFLF